MPIGLSMQEAYKAGKARASFHLKRHVTARGQETK
jgi:hypothetical protein